MGWGTGNIGGGSGGLNFKVVGGTSEPTSPKENTIWVNTDTGITSYIFSATEPESPVEGMVWISTGTSSFVGFNALKKNAIQVYPLSAKQYVSGAWVDVTAQSYQNGEWVYWYLAIVQNGVAKVDFSGNVRNTTAMTVTNENGYIKVTSINSTTSGAATAEKHDVTKYNTIEVDVDVKVIGSYFAIGLSKALNASSADATESNMVVKTKTVKTGRQTLTVNIEDYSGEYYVSTLMYGLASVSKTMEYHIYDFKVC